MKKAILFFIKWVKGLFVKKQKPSILSQTGLKPGPEFMEANSEVNNKKKRLFAQQPKTD
jgi:hypothetical protein